MGWGCVLDAKQLKNLVFAFGLWHRCPMPKAVAISAHGLGFEDGLRKMLNCPPPPSSKSAKRSAKKQKRKK
jgi:hypothetical protein